MIRSLQATALFCLLLLSHQLQAQSGSWCNSSRYDQEIFTNVLITPDITYGSNVDYTGAATTLTMDIYEPDGDTAAIRPLIVWAHGGSFVGGTKNDGDVTSLCTHFAKRGYVCVSINYRLGMAIPPNQTAATTAVYRAVQDMKAAIRYFRQDAATSNTYRIDPNTIFAAGSSAGAFTALHLAYLDQPSELPSQIDTTVLGGMEGESGNPGYSSRVNAVVNLCGALGNKTWLTAGDVPLCSMHGTNDNIVPYATAMLYMLNIFPIMVVDGSYSINEYANTIGMPNEMFTYFGQDHVPYSGSLAYMDTTVRFVSNFLYTQLGCTPSDPLPLPNTFPSTGIQDSPFTSGILVYPNPSCGNVTVENVSAASLHVELFDVTGRMVRENFSREPKLLLDGSNLAKGVYTLRVSSQGVTSVRKISFY